MNPLSRFINPPKDIILVCICSVLIAVVLGSAIWDMKFWPTDTEAYYLDAAAQLPQMKYLSQMHASIDARGWRWLHGKEIFVLSASIAQRLLGDTQTLRPFILVCILSIGFSQILVFCIAKNFWGHKSGFFFYLLFTTCFWPYQYILFTGHQPLGLFFFLLAVFLLQQVIRQKLRIIFYFMSGLTLCLSIFSSTISSLYVPYYLAVFLYVEYKELRSMKLCVKLINLTISSFLVLLGFMSAFLYINYPNFAYNIKGYIEYIHKNIYEHHSYVNQPVLIQWFQHPERPVHGGIKWVFKYFLLIMPIMFPCYLFCLVYLIGHSVQRIKDRFRLKIEFILIVLVSLSSPLLAQMRGIAQVGRIYFTFFIGIILLISYAAHIFLENKTNKTKDNSFRRWVPRVIFFIFILNVGINFYLFFSDVYPTRMGVTYLSRKIKELNLKRLYTYPLHTHITNTVNCLDPNLLKSLRFTAIKNINQPQEGYILIPPVTGISIYYASQTRFNDFNDDVYLNELFRKGNIGNYAIASFPTLTSSRIWLHEEEVLSYKTFILNHPLEKDFNKTKVWLLDVKKLKEDEEKNQPSAEYMNLINQNIRNIGSEESFRRFEGLGLQVGREKEAGQVGLLIYKVGEPKDQLKAYVYRYSDQGIWFPVAGFTSLPVNGEAITTDSRGEIVAFNFNPLLKFTPGLYNFMIYRTGKPNDKDFYRIYSNSENVVKR